MSELTEHVKYPFEVDGRWAVAYHVPYKVRHEGRSYAVLARIFAKPSVHGQIQVGCEGETVADYDNLTPGDVVEIAGDEWRVAAVEYRTRIVLERVRGSEGNADA
ncbi:hypothetical protein [Streptomyces sp. XD-27]|uniref:hypothetical protein n=1 Tax=Streptomyces sp. XD-27 TaxID=3062779 RepID=UPI0026F4460A|nr:hypothetical protein [Streptomyces sp. XD-27]WKX70245.1 hypothetical protein Q3Y56_10225 [Streptomyces sp. XD-27]